MNKTYDAHNPETFPTWSNRAHQWFDFSNEVFAHIEEYTIPQYGDAPDDQIEKYSIESCLEQVSKYLNRYGKVSDERQMRDFLKMAHYVQCAYEKHIEKLNAKAEQNKRDIANNS